MQQRYMLTIWDLFTIGDGEVAGGRAEVAVMDGGQEIDRLVIHGKCQSREGYRRGYEGKPGLTAKLVSGPGKIQFLQC